MKKFSLTLLAASAMAIAGVAQADAIFYPDGTVVELGDSSLEVSDSSSIDSMDTTVLGAGSSDLDLSVDSSSDTTILGAPASTSSTTTVTTTIPQMVYVQPNINWDRSTALSQMRSNVHLMNRGRVALDNSATATFNSPTRAGEMSTMTNGVPNLVTNNDRVIVGSYTIPYTAVNGNGSYYVFSY